MDDILALYEWAPGDCFRCAATGVDTTHIKEIPTPVGVRFNIRACRDCVLAIEDGLDLQAQEAGVEYKPGNAGHELRRGGAPGVPACRRGPVGGSLPGE
jgi:hypothetical protein